MHIQLTSILDQFDAAQALSPCLIYSVENVKIVVL